MRPFGVFAFIILLTLSLMAQQPPETTAQQSFANGLDAFQKNHFDDARTWFRDAAHKDPSQVVTWYNLGLAEQKLGHNGWSLAFWRKALALRPGYEPAVRAIGYVKPKLEKGDIPHDVELWESLRTSLLAVATAYQFSLFSAILFFVTVWLSLVYAGERRRAILDEKPLPMFPFGAAISGVLFATLLTLTVCKFVDEQDLRATIVTKKVEAKALPDPTSTTLFELYEGLEVIVRQSRAGWVQVTYPGGATGWMTRENIFTTADWIGK